MQEKIYQAVKNALASLRAPEAAFVVERPRDMSHGDYATNAALVAKVDAQALADKLKIEGVEKVEVVGKFINFFLTREELVPQPQKIPQLYTGKKIIVDYTQPNPFKPFHIGHLMSNTIGESLVRMFEASGAQVAHVNYQGDIGPHVAKAIWGLQKNNLNPADVGDLGKAYVAGSSAYEEDPAAKTEIDNINQRLYVGDSELKDIYETGRATSLEHFDELYATLGTRFDRLFFESETAPIGLEIVKSHPELFEQSDGAIVFHGEKYGTHTRVFVTGKGTPTYEAKELGLVKLKQKEFPFDLAITTTAKEQDGFFEVIEKVVGILWPTLAGKYSHVSHGMLRFATGKMASRKGNVITGESLLADLTQAAKEKMQGRELRDADKTAEQIAVGAIKYAVLKQGSGRDIIFDPEKSLSLEGDSGPYLQYARVRALSLLAKAREAGIEPAVQDVPEHAGVLERTLIHYPEAVARAAREMEPHYVTTYLTELASAFNSWYAGGKVIGGTHPHYGVLLTRAFEKTMSQGLNVLGIPAPEEM